jgi:CheY-like chemotaxis protein
MSIAEKYVDQGDSHTPPELARDPGHAASTIAHDIDIALAPIALYTDALLEHEALGERARHYLMSIRRAVGDVARNVGRLRELDRVLKPAPRPVDGRRNPAPPAPARSLRVLLIDDDPSLIDSLRSALIDEGHKVNAANGGQAGIEAFRSARSSGMPFDIVITDLAMPDVDGRQVVASLRAVSSATPIILLTGWRHQLSDGVERPLNVDRLLGKPPRIRELRAALAELTGRRAGERLE